MFKKSLSLLTLAAVSSVVFANIDLRTNIRDIYYRGTCEEAGSITMVCNSAQDFASASTEQPVYIRVGLNQGAVLCQTLVTHRGTTTAEDGFGLGNNAPIYLAMRLDGASAGVHSITAHPQTVSICRWKRGERFIWLRVQTASNTWVATLGVPSPNLPDNQIRVAWTFGVTAARSFEQNAGLFAAGLANREANQRDENAAGLPVFPVENEELNVSTLVCVNASNSILSAFPANDSILEFDTISWDYRTLGVEEQSSENNITYGFQTEVNFSGDDSIARGQNWGCSSTITCPKQAKEYGLLCVAQSTSQFAGDTLVCVSKYLRLRTTCTNWKWNPGSVVSIAVPAGASYGFLTDDFVEPEEDVLANPYNWYGNDPFTDDTGGFYPVVGVSFCTINSDAANLGTVGDARANSTAGTFTTQGGYLLARQTDLWYDGAVRNTGFFYNICLTVCADYRIQPTSVDLAVSVWVANRPNIWWQDPSSSEPARYDYTQINCPPSLIPAGSANLLDVQRFVVCDGEDAVIFFPYLPKLFDTPFFTGLAIDNVGCVDFTAGNLFGSIYEADGSHWEVDFPALAQTHMQTYAFTEGDQGVAFYNADDGSVVVPTPTGNDLVLGDKRMTMYVYGTWVKTYSDQPECADLDGAALITSTEDLISLGYLPRNIINFAGKDSGDLPMVLRKTQPSFNLAAPEMSAHK